MNYTFVFQCWASNRSGVYVDAEKDIVDIVTKVLCILALDLLSNGDKVERFATFREFLYHRN